MRRAHGACEEGQRENDEDPEARNRHGENAEGAEKQHGPAEDAQEPRVGERDGVTRDQPEPHSHGGQDHEPESEAPIDVGSDGIYEAVAPDSRQRLSEERDAHESVQRRRREEKGADGAKHAISSHEVLAPLRSIS